MQVPTILIFSLALSNVALAQLEFNDGKYKMSYDVSESEKFIYFTIESVTNVDAVAFGLSTDENIVGSHIYFLNITDPGAIAVPVLSYRIDDKEELISLPPAGTLAKLMDYTDPSITLNITKTLRANSTNDIKITLGEPYHIIWFELESLDIPTNVKGWRFGMEGVCFEGESKECATSDPTPASSTTVGFSTTEPSKTTSFPGENQLEFNDGKYKISWNLHEPFISFEIESYTNGSIVAFGISAMQSMLGADIIAIEVIDNLETIVGDYHVGLNGHTIVLDPNQAAGTLLEKSHSWIKVKVTRRLIAGDPDDIEIKKNGTYHLVWFETEAEIFPNSLNDLKFGVHQICFGNENDCNMNAHIDPSRCIEITA